MISFAACKDAKKAEEVVNSTTTETVETEEIAPVEEAVKLTPAEALKAFKDYAKAYGEAYNNIVKDPQKFNELVGQFNAQKAEIDKYTADFTSAQTKEYERALKIIIDANTGGTKK